MGTLGGKGLKTVAIRPNHLLLPTQFTAVALFLAFFLPLMGLRSCLTEGYLQALRGCRRAFFALPGDDLIKAVIAT